MELQMRIPEEIFDERGRFIPVEDAIIVTWPDHIVASYQILADTYTAMMKLELDVERVTKALHQAVRDLRTCENQLAAAPKPSRISLVRDMIRGSFPHVK
jgi:hypothetical protein